MTRPPSRRAGARERPGRSTERIMPGTAHWDAHYTEHIQRYAFVAECMRPGASVLDAGCGCGYGSAYLADHGAGRVVAVDISAEALRMARDCFDRPSVVWQQDDCQTLTAAEAHAPFDVICNLENLEHLAEPARFLDRVLELLGPEGVFVASTPNRRTMSRLRGLRPDAGSANPFHSHEFSEDEFRALLMSRFGDVPLFYQTWDPVDRLVYGPALNALWSNPAVRFGRWLQRAVRGRPIAECAEDLLPPLQYQIVPQSPGEALVVTLLARCRAPRRGSVNPCPPSRMARDAAPPGSPSSGR